MIPKILIENPAKSWWSGDIRVQPFMKELIKTLDKYYPAPHSKERTDIYNRAYEAVYSAIVTYDKSQKKRPRVSAKLNNELSAKEICILCDEPIEGKSYYWCKIGPLHKNCRNLSKLEMDE